MKHVLCLMVVAGVLVARAPSYALVDSKATCVNACDTHGQTSRTCNWAAAKRARFNRCRTNLIKRCRRFGVASMCPAPPPPPPTTTTTTPTTTTRPYIPPTTTTTLPPPPVVNLEGTYQFEGYVTTDACGLFGVGSYAPVPFNVTGQSGTNLVGTMGANVVPASGTFTPATGGWNLGGTECDGTGCCANVGVGVGADVFPAATIYYFEGSCSDGTYCYVEASGLAYPY